MLRAIREGVICPIGVVGHATFIAMTDDEREAWCPTAASLPPHPCKPRRSQITGHMIF